MSAVPSSEVDGQGWNRDNSRPPNPGDMQRHEETHWVPNSWDNFPDIASMIRPLRFVIVSKSAVNLKAFWTRVPSALLAAAAPRDGGVRLFGQQRAGGATGPALQ
jgi:hypothetical protein